MGLAQDNFRQLLAAGDVEGLRAAWAQAAPHLPQPDAAQAEVIMHRARTQAESLPLRARAYSHAWLIERGLPSDLPDHLKPKAERLYPRAVSAVGIAIGMGISNPLLKPALREIQAAMGHAVEDVYADGRGDDIPLVRRRMVEAREVAERKLFGRWGVKGEVA